MLTQLKVKVSPAKYYGIDIRLVMMISLSIFGSFTADLAM